VMPTPRPMPEPMVTQEHRQRAHQLLSSIAGWPERLEGRRHAHFAVAERVLALTLAVEEQRQSEDRLPQLPPCKAVNTPAPRRPPQHSGKSAASGERPEL
jgi:hypothetical protein